MPAYVSVLAVGIDEVLGCVLPTRKMLWAQGREVCWDPLGWCGGDGCLGPRKLQDL